MGSSPFESFDIEDPKLDTTIEAAAFTSGGYPYSKKLKRKVYDPELERLQIELLKLQAHIRATGERILILFEGRDAAGKGGAIARFTQHLPPRHVKTVALPRPTEKERGQWYFQRYAEHLPTKGDMTLFDRSWYNRAGVERVMGFCSRDEVADFLREAPNFEGMLVRDGISLFKFYLAIGREMQLKRFHQRRHKPLKHWKLTDVDLAAMSKWDDYTSAEQDLFRFTHTPTTPWTVILANDQRRARLEAIRHVLLAVDYGGRDNSVLGKQDLQIVTSGPGFLEQQ
jgi:polyphosphate kinase